MKLSYISVITVLVVTLAAACPARADADGINIFVSILPQQFFVEKIGGELADVTVMVPPGAHPAIYEPAPKQMAALAEARIYFAIGVPFETAWMAKIKAANPKLKIIHTDAGIEKQPIDRTHAHEGHDHGSGDPHIWLSPPLVMVQARHVLTALTAAAPEHADDFEAKYNAFIMELLNLDAKLRRRFGPDAKQREFLVFHPSWGYFADAYGLKQIPIEISGKSPKAADIQRLITHARQKQIRVVLVQPQLSSKSAEMIARSIGGRTVTADPLAVNWAENLLYVADQIHGAAR